MSKVAQRRKAQKTKALGQMIGSNYTGRFIAGAPVPENRTTRRMQEQAAKRAARKIT